MKNFKKLFCVTFLSVTCQNYLAAQFNIDWNYVEDNTPITNPLLDSWIDSDGNTNLLLWDKDTFYNLRKINADGEEIYNAVYTFPADLDMTDPRGFKQDAEGNIYSWGIAETCPPFCTEVILAKFNNEFELEWVYFFPDTVGIRDESFVFSPEGNPIVITTSQTGYDIWEFENSGEVINSFFLYTGFYYLGIFRSEFYNNKISVLNFGTDTLRLWQISLDSESAEEKQFIGIDEFPSSPELWQNEKSLASSGNLYLWLTRLNTSGEAVKYLVKLNAEGDTLWTLQVPLPTDWDVLEFDKLFINSDINKLITVAAFRDTDDSVFAIIHAADTLGNLLSSKKLPLVEYFNTSYLFDAVYDTTLDRIYIYMPDIGIEEKSGIMAVSTTGEVLLTDMLGVAYTGFTGRGIVLTKADGKIILINDKQTFSLYNNIEVTQMSETPVAVENNASPEIEIFPNPFSDQFSIHVPGMQEIELILTDITGRRLMQKKLHSSTTSISTVSLPAGIYYYLCISNKTVVQHGSMLKIY